MMNNHAIDDQRYIQQYIRAIALREGAARHIARAMPASRRNPITDAIEIPSLQEAGHDLYMATSRYYLDRASQGLAMPREVGAQLIALQEGIHGADCASAVNDALRFFVHSEASVEDADVRNAIRAAQLCLKSLQSTWAEMPAVSAFDDRWML